MNPNKGLHSGGWWWNAVEKWEWPFVTCSPQSPLGPGGGHTFLLSLHIEVQHVLVKLKYVKQNQYASMCQCHIYKVVNRFSSRTDTVPLCALIFSMRLRLHNNFEVTHYIIIHKDNLRKKKHFNSSRTNFKMQWLYTPQSSVALIICLYKNQSDANQLLGTTYGAVGTLF